MFHFDITMEDSRLMAQSEDGKDYDCSSSDNHTGNNYNFFATPEQLAMIISIMLHNDGTPDGYEEMYKILEPLFVGCLPECRPIP